MAAFLYVLLGLAVGIEVLKLRAIGVQTSSVSDVFSYLRAAREIRAGRRLRECLRFYFPGHPATLNLPPLQILALVPFAGRSLWVAWLLPVLQHLATACAVFGFGWLATGSALVGGVAAGWYLLTPAASLNSASLTPRPLGVLLSGVAFLCAWFHWRTGSAPAFAGMLVACAGALLAHRMTAQLLILVFPAWGIVAMAVAGWRHAPLLTVMPAAVALAWLLSGGAYGPILADHWRRVRWHVRHGSQNAGRKAPPPPRRVIAGNPYLLLVAWLLGRGALDGLWRDLMPLLVFAAGAVLLSLAWIWGNGHRHVMFSAVPVAMVIAALAPRFGAAEWILAGLCSAIAVGVVTRSVRRVLTQQTGVKLISDGARDCMDYLSRQPPGLVLVVPNVAYPPLAYFTDHSILAAGHGHEALTFNRQRVRPKLASQKGLRHLLNTYPIDWMLVLREDHAPDEDSASWPWFKEKHVPAHLVRRVFGAGSCGVYRPVVPRDQTAETKWALECVRVAGSSEGIAWR